MGEAFRETTRWMRSNMDGFNDGSKVALAQWVGNVMLLAGIPIIDWLAGKVDIKTRTRSPLSSFNKAFVTSLFTLLNVVQWQFSFHAAVMYLHLGVSYWDALPINHLARHSTCNSCLMFRSAQSAAELGELAWAQFF